MFFWNHLPALLIGLGVVSFGVAGWHTASAGVGQGRWVAPVVGWAAAKLEKAEKWLKGILEFVWYMSKDSPLVPGQIVAWFVAIALLMVLLSGVIVGGVYLDRMGDAKWVVGSLFGSPEKDFIRGLVVLALPIAFLILAGGIWIGLFLASILLQGYAKWCAAPVPEKRQARLAGFFCILGLGFLVGSRLVVPYANSQTAALLAARLESGDLRGANLRDMDLSGLNLLKADLFGADLQGANLVGTDLSRSRLVEARLAGACLDDANLHRANLEGADLQGASLIDASLGRARL